MRLSMVMCVIPRECPDLPMCVHPGRIEPGLAKVDFAYRLFRLSGLAGRNRPAQEHGKFIAALDPKSRRESEAK